MLELLPRELALEVLHHFDPDFTTSLFGVPILWVPLTLVSHTWRAIALSVLRESTSLVRKHRKHVPRVTEIEKHSERMMKELQSMGPCVKELEVHSSLDLVGYSHVFSCVRSLTVLGCGVCEIPFDGLETLAVCLSTGKVTLPSLDRLKRLDLVVDDTLTPDALSGFAGPIIEEVNIITMGSISTLSLPALFTFLSKLPLRKLTLKNNTSSFIKTKQDMSPFFQYLTNSELAHLHLDIAYLDHPNFLLNILEHSPRSTQPPLKLTLAEYRSTSLWNTLKLKQITRCIQWLNSFYEVHTLGLHYSPHTEKGIYDNALGVARALQGDKINVENVYVIYPSWEETYTEWWGLKTETLLHYESSELAMKVQWRSGCYHLEPLKLEVERRCVETVLGDLVKFSNVKK